METFIQQFVNGDVYMIGAMVGYYVEHLLLVILAAMSVCAVLGYVIEKLAYRPLRNSPRIAALITAIGVSILLEYSGQLVFGADPKFFPTLVAPQPLFYIGGVSIGTVPVIIFSVSILLMAILRHIRRTPTKEHIWHGHY